MWIDSRSLGLLHSARRRSNSIYRSWATTNLVTIAFMGQDSSPPLSTCESFEDLRSVLGLFYYCNVTSITLPFSNQQTTRCSVSSSHRYRLHQLQRRFAQRFHQRHAGEAQQVDHQPQTFFHELFRALLPGRTIIKPEQNNRHLVEPQQIR